LVAGVGTPANALPINLKPNATPQLEPAVTAQRPARPGGIVTASRERSAAKESAGELAAKAKGILSIIISLEQQQLTLYSDGQPIARSRVSTGQAGRSTPAGVFSIIQKDRFHRSNLYDDAPMYFMQRITWSGVALHQGIVPNYPASHGCVRLPEAFARQLWAITRLGVRVTIARGDVAPVPISHSRLFAPARVPAEAGSLQAVREPVGPSSAEALKAAYSALEVTRLGGGQRPVTASDVSKDPFVDAAPKAGVIPVESTSADVVKMAFNTFALAKPDRVKAPAVAMLTDGRPLKPGPVSVFISRKEGKLFVRKGFEPVFDVAVTVERPDQPLGTHVFTALAVNDDNASMRWSVVSLPTASSVSGKVNGRRSEQEPKVEQSAAEALDRITIPQDARDRISALMSPGASLIISDQGLGPETGTGTDFIVLTH
jgi:lipoprotein-anchoring transpeptidase ErfK/SrfK